jgi:hypothetical protein
MKDIFDDRPPREIVPRQIESNPRCPDCRSADLRRPWGLFAPEPMCASGSNTWELLGDGQRCAAGVATFVDQALGTLDPYCARCLPRRGNAWSATTRVVVLRWPWRDGVPRWDGTPVSRHNGWPGSGPCTCP